MLSSLDTGSSFQDRHCYRIALHAFLVVVAGFVLGAAPESFASKNILVVVDPVKPVVLCEKLRAALQDLDLTDKMRTGQNSQPLDRYSRSQEVVGRDMDWDWEGGILI